MGPWTKRLRRAVFVLRALVLALSLPLLTGGSFPSWPALLGVEGPHVCRCAIERHGCVCARCNPEDDELAFTSESLSGRCGEDEVLGPGRALRGVLPRGVHLAPLGERVSLVPLPPILLGRVTPRPPVPPPRHASSPPV